MALLQTKTLDQFSTQDLLDILCYTNRAERFVEGTMASYTAEIDKIVEELVRRVKRDKS
jgi:hypothetical protein